MWSREALPSKLELLRDELTGKNPTPIERLLVERVLACWLQVQVADIRDAQGEELVHQTGPSFTSAE